LCDHQYTIEEEEEVWGSMVLQKVLWIELCYPGVPQVARGMASLERKRFMLGEEQYYHKWTYYWNTADERKGEE
jgi:hypothetical protein